MARKYVTATDQKIKKLNQRLARKRRYYANKGIEIDAPTIDPRGLTGSQKTAAIRLGESFMRARFVAGNGGVPLSREYAARYNKAQKRWNERAKKLRQSLPEEHENFNYFRYGAIDNDKPVNTPRMQKPGMYAYKKRSMESFYSDRGLKRVVEDMEKKLSDKGMSDMDKRIRSTLSQLLDGGKGTRNAKLLWHVRRLTPSQRIKLFEGTKFMDAVGYVAYEGTGRGREHNETVRDSAHDRAWDLVQQAKTW